MLASFLKAHALRRGARVLPGGWVTMLALSPKGRAISLAAARHGWRQVQKRRAR
jgi:predicted nuclease with RNAse H fold